MGSSSQSCPECGAAIDETQAGGVCVACLIGGAIGVEAPGEALGQIGGHELIEMIARGGMGIVYRARQKEPAREVALKALPGAELMHNEARQRFRIEARAMARLEHPHILPVYEIGEEDGTPFYTMKLATGGSLAQRVSRYAGKWREIAELIATLAEAVQFAHSRGVLHRDLKPGNILFDEDGTMYVSDFGLAKLVGTDTDLTRTLAMMGTPAYLAPELVNGGKNGVSAASDVWSLGVMLYELLAGRPPFRAENTAALLRQIVEEEPEALENRTSRRAGSDHAGERDACTFSPPRDLAVITFKALSKDPARRYSTAQELVDDLRRWLAGEPIHARPVPLAERAWLWARRKPAIAALVSLLTLTLIGSAILLVRSNEHLREVDAQRRGEIHRALLEKASAERLSQLPGRRERALALVREACVHGSSLQARSVAASVLAIRDIRLSSQWHAVHPGSTVIPLAFAPDLNMHIAIVPSDQVRDPSWKNGSLGLWRTSDLKLLKQVPLSDRNALSNVALSLEARWVSATIGDSKLEIWDMENERLFASFESSDRRPAAGFDPEGDSLTAVINGRLQRIRLSRETSGSAQTRNLGVRDTNIGHAHRVCVSPDGRVVAVQHSDKNNASGISMTVWRSMPSEPKHVFDYTIRIPGRCQPGVAWAPDSQNLFSFDSSSDTLVMHYTGFALAGSHSKAIAPVVGKRCCVAVNPDGRTLGWADESGMLHLEDLWAGHTEYQFPASSECLVFASDGRRFAYCPTPDSVGIAELHRSPILEAYRTNPNPMNRKHVEIQQLAVSPDGRWIATCDRFHLALWRCSDMKCVAANLITPEGTTSFPETTFENLHFSSDSRRVYVQETRAHRCVLDLVEQSDGLTYLAGLRRATIMTNDGMSTVPGMGNLAAESSVHDLVAASPNGQWQITTRTDENASVCNLWRNGSVTSKTAHLPEPAGAVWRTSVFSPDGRWWAVGARACEGTSVPGFVYSENTSEGNPRKVLSTAVCHSHLAVSSDGRWLLGGADGDYIIWDSATWKEVFRLPCALSEQLQGCASFSPDGSLLALEVEHGKIRLLRAGSWEEVLTITPPQFLPIVRMAFSPDGKHLYTTGGQILHRWNVARLREELGKMGIGW